MKRPLLFVLGALIGAFLVVSFARAQVADPNAVFIKGEMSIRFDTRTDKKDGVTDKYRLKLNVSDSVVFDGTIEHLPFIKGTMRDQQGSLVHAIECFVVNPRNTAQTRNVGRIFGAVPIDKDNVYRFEDGNLKIGVFGSAGFQGMESTAKGLALGKPPAKTGFLDRMKADIKSAVNINRLVGGKTVSIAVTQYDKMEFRGHRIPAGPVPVYPEVLVDGEMLYDYDRTAWHFRNVTVTYASEGRRIQDTLTGSIRWSEAKNRASTGEGEYHFDIRVNEPPASEVSLFTGPVDESAFFAEDVAVPALVGTMKYKDTIINDTVTASQVSIDLKGNQITRNQALYLAKLLMMSAVVPMNSE